MFWLRVLKETTLLVVIGVFAGAVTNALRSDAYKLSWVGRYHPSASAPGIQLSTSPQSNAPRMDTESPSIAAEAASKRPERAKPADVKKGQVTGSAAGRKKENLRDIAPPKDPGLAFLEISGEIALRMQNAGALFLDARRSSAYESGHVQGARSIAVWEHDADAKIAALAKSGIPFDQVMVTYCSGGDCKDAEGLARKLYDSGFYNIYVYKEGFPEWEKHRWPVNRGNQP